MKKITISGSIRRRLAALLLAAAACAGVTGAYAEAVSVIRPGAATPSPASTVQPTPEPAPEAIQPAEAAVDVPAEQQAA